MYKYKKTKLNGKRIYSHRKVWTLAHGKIPDGFVIHHKNGDSKDNRLSNLDIMDKMEHHKLHQKDRHGNPATLVKYYRTHDVWSKGLTSKNSQKLREWHEKTVKIRNANFLPKKLDMIAMFKDGHKVTEIAEKYGICTRTVYSHLKGGS